VDPYIGKTIASYVGIAGALMVFIGTAFYFYFDKQVQKVTPYRQKIRTATATVQVTIMSDTDINTHFMDRGGYIALRKGRTLLLVMSSTDSWGRQTGKGEVIYRAVFNMDAEDPAVKKPLYSLKETDQIEIYYYSIPKESIILGGEAICTFNGTVRREIAISPQDTKNGICFVHNLENIFSDFIKN